MPYSTIELSLLANNISSVHNLLTDPIIRVRLQDGSSLNASLSEVFSLMMQDKVKAFQALRPHQRHAWHTFLSQLGALACKAADCSDIPDSPDEWEHCLRSLTAPSAGDSHWHLIIADIEKPAFLQPPASGELSCKQDKIIHTPNELDILVPAKNHDIKIRTGAYAEPDDWMFALISLQTMEGFMGRGNYGVARMNGGASSRPVLGLARATGGIGDRLKRDVEMLLATRGDTLEQNEHIYRDQGISLVWLESWDGNTSLAMKDLDPWFIEICRRVRLKVGADGIYAYGVPTNNARVAAKALNGCTGDAWTPIKKSGLTKDADSSAKALSITSHGFRYNLLCDILFDDDNFLRPGALKLTRAEETNNSVEWILIAQCVARGQGKTDGWYERIVPVPGAIAVGLGMKQRRLTIGKVSKEQIGEIKKIASALSKSLAAISSGGTNTNTKTHGDKAKVFKIKLDRYADKIFFDNLWRRCEEDSDNHTENTQAFVKNMDKYAQQLLIEAGETLPCPSIRRHKAQALADRVYYGSTRKEFSFLKEKPRTSDSQIK